MFVKNSCVQCTYTPYIEAVLWPGDIKSDGRNLLSMFASLDLNQPWPRGGLSFSLSERMRGLYQSTERMISVLYDNISTLFDFKTMHNSTIKFKCIQYLVLVLDIGIYCYEYILLVLLLILFANSITYL